MAAQNEIGAARLQAVEDSMPIGGLTDPSHIAAATMYVLVKGIAAVRNALLVMQGAFAASNPVIAGIAIAIAGIAFAGLKLHGHKTVVDDLKSAYDRWADAVRNTKAALDKLVDADVSALSARLRIVETRHAEQAAMDNLNKVRANSKSTTLEIAISRRSRPALAVADPLDPLGDDMGS